MQQRQLRLGDILDDYCPRERRVTNHAVVAMVGPDVKQTRCTTCDAEHEYKHAKVPRQRRKQDTPAALAAQAAAGPKRVPHEPDGASDSIEVSDSPELNADSPADNDAAAEDVAQTEQAVLVAQEAAPTEGEDTADDEPIDDDHQGTEEEGPVHRPLIRATLPRVGGQAPPPRPAPDFTIRQPGGRQNRFRQRQQGGQQFFGNRSNGGNQGGGGGGHRQPGGWNSRPQDGAPRHSRRHGKRTK
jgi:hypothetical protein